LRHRIVRQHLRRTRRKENASLLYAELVLLLQRQVLDPMPLHKRHNIW
jgi:hypothetical protein